uniref:Uncharacterized protein n=1 Tax=Arundo donax TaxID=35708 RepID=A0A0A9DCI4_ARUDO
MVRSMQDGEPKSKAYAPPIAGIRQGGEARNHLPGEALAQRDPQALAVSGDRQHQFATAAVRSMAAWVASVSRGWAAAAERSGRTGREKSCHFGLSSSFDQPLK